MKVFLNYAYEDAGIADRVRDALLSEGFDVADPVHDHFPGDNWAKEIARALEESRAMVVLLTSEAAYSKHVMLNIEYALGDTNYNNRLIPVLIGDRNDIPTINIPWIVRDMPWFKIDTTTNSPNVTPIAEAIFSHS